MKLFFLVSLQTLLVSLCFIGCTNKESDSKQVQLQLRVDEVRKKLEAENQINVPSLNVLIETPTERYFVHSIGENGTVVTENTNYRFASVTKTFTAVAILKQHQDGWLNIDDTITQFIPESNVTYVPNDIHWNIPFKARITIKQLLQHTAGIYDIDNDAVPGYDGKSYTDYTITANPNHQFKTSEFAQVLTEGNLYYWEPGKDYHYSNTGYNILGEIVSRVYSQRKGENKSYGDYLFDHVYGPNSKVPIDFVFPELASEKQLPTPYVKGMIITGNDIEIKDEENVSHHVAEGNGIGTMKDLNKFIRSSMKGSNVLTSETVSLMQQPSQPGTNNYYGLGCTFFTDLGYGHNGASNGYLNLAAYDKTNDVSIVVMMPLWDITNGMASLTNCLKALSEAGSGVRQVLGIPPSQP